MQFFKLIFFEGKRIRSIWDKDKEDYFSVVDEISALTDSSNPRDYWYQLKKCFNDFEKFEVSTKCRQLKMKAQDGKMRETDTLDTEGIFRRYWSDLKIDLNNEGSQLYEKIVQLKMKVPDGKMRETDTLDTEGIFRLIESVPSPKTKPFFNIWVLSNNFHQKKE